VWRVCGGSLRVAVRDVTRRDVIAMSRCISPHRNEVHPDLKGREVRTSFQSNLPALNRLIYPQT
jgi:hypothetical protein